MEREGRGALDIFAARLVDFLDARDVGLGHDRDDFLSSFEDVDITFLQSVHGVGLDERFVLSPDSHAHDVRHAVSIHLE